MIPPTPAVEQDMNKFNFKIPNGLHIVDNTKSVENLYQINRKESPRSDFLFVPKLADSRRLSIPVVLIPADSRSDSKFNSSDNVYIQNIYKAASVTSLGNFGSIAAEPMPIKKNKDGKW